MSGGGLLSPAAAGGEALDLWTFDLATRAWLSLSGGPAPAARMHHCE
jgi:hypothetical protein